jgi:signal transduction histidine kinase
MGIPAAFRTRIFEKYVRIDQRALSERNSQGLGLVFCRTAVEAHGGEIWVEENSPRGSCFCVRLPRQPRLPARAGSVEKQAAPQLVAVASAG